MTTPSIDEMNSELEATLLDLVNGELDQNKKAEDDKQVTEPVDSTEEVVADEVAGDATEAESQDADAEVAKQGSEDGEQGSEPSATSQKADYLAILEDLGYDTDDMTQEEGKEAVLRLTKRSTQQPKQEPAPAPEQKTLSDVTESIANKSSQEVSAPKTSKEKRLGKLIRDAKLESLVEYRGDAAVPKEGTGAEGISAAASINEYLHEYRVRVQRFAEDPEGFLLADVEGESLRDKIAAIVKGELSVLTEAQQKERAKLEHEQAIRTEREKQDKFFADHTAELYKLRADGTPKMVPGEEGDVPAFTEFGKLVVKEYQKLYSLAPQQPTSRLMEAAYERAKEITPAPAASPTGAEKKKKFLESRGGKPVASLSSKTPATPGEMAEGGTRLLDMILATPENADNPVLPSLRDAT